MSPMILEKILLETLLNKQKIARNMGQQNFEPISSHSFCKQICKSGIASSLFQASDIGKKTEIKTITRDLCSHLTK
jgi:hypothetical protein